MKEKFTREFLLENVDEFYNIYMQRPIMENSGGMKSAHMFPSWLVMKTFKPEYIIESGVWKGLGTWFFEQASPSSTIISIDPNPQFRVYNSQKAKYQTEDFLKSDWSFLNKENTILFLDDHQNSLERLKFAQSIGIKKIMVEDNYPFCQGDCYSPKKILSKKDYIIDLAGNKSWHKHNIDDYDFLINNLTYYQEFPPLFKDKLTRWGDLWNSDIYPTPDQLLSDDTIEKYHTFYDERKDYTWICYMEFK